MNCYICGVGGETSALRPYGKDGQPICFPCMKAEPERECEAEKQFSGRIEENGSVVGAMVAGLKYSKADTTLKEQQCPGCRGLKQISGVDCALCDGRGTVWVEVPV